MKTRDRILETARELFNARGVGPVTLQQIADAVGIRQGNLWYHFKVKADLFTALADGFEQELADKVYADRQPVASIHQAASVMVRYYAVSWRYRFFYANSADITAIEPDMNAFLQRETRRSWDLSQLQVQELCDAGVLTCSVDDAKELAHVISVHLRYGLQYRQDLTGARAEQSHLAIADLFYQSFLLIRPWLAEGVKPANISDLIRADDFPPPQCC